MKLLIVTQIIDKQDPILGFFHRWVEEFAKHCERVTVICLKEGQHELPENVRVLSLGKEKLAPPSHPNLVIPANPLAAARAEGIQRPPSSLGTRNYELGTVRALQARLIYSLRFLRLIWRERKHCDAVFVHMNPEYMILGSILWKLLGKRLGMWYAHGTVTFRLRLAVCLSNLVFTSTHEGCRVSSNKVHIVGQGIDTENFSPGSKPPEMHQAVTVGRIARVKNLDTLIRAVAIMRQEKIPIKLDIYGTSLTDGDRQYEQELYQLVQDERCADSIRFCGSVSQAELPRVLRAHGVFLNAGQTGSLDKAILEAAACGCIVVSSNPGAKAFLNFCDLKLFVPNVEGEFVNALSHIMDVVVATNDACRSIMVSVVRKEHSVQQLISSICNVYR